MRVITRKSKILMVDDEIKTCHLFSRYLSNRGFWVETASDGQNAMLKAEEFRPECILLDVRMPHGGLGLLHRLRKKFPEIVIIMVSAIVKGDQGSDFLNAGAFACIEKPVNLEDLLEKICQSLHLELQG